MPWPRIWENSNPETTEAMELLRNHTTGGGDASGRLGRLGHVMTGLLASAAAVLAVAAAALPSPAMADELTGSIDVPFTKYWDDEGYRDRRPETVTFRLYEEGRPDDMVATVTLGEGDATADDEWHGKFESVPQKRDGQDIEYVVKEDVPEGYIASYDYGYDGYGITFTDDSRVYSTYSLYFGCQDENGTWWEAQIPSWDSEGSPLPEIGKWTDDIASIPGTYWVGASRIPASDAHPSGSSGRVSDESMANPWRLPHGDLKRLVEVRGTEHIESMTDWPVGYYVAWEYSANIGRHTPRIRIVEDSVSWGKNRYSTKPTGVRFEIKEFRPIRNPDKPIEITDTINLRDFEFEKVWEDEGHESHRPSSVTVDIYQDGDMEHPFATTTVRDTAAVDGRTWKGKFSDLPRYYDDGTYREHEYTIVERPVRGYSAEYDSDWYNGLEFTFGEDTNIYLNTLLSPMESNESVWGEIAPGGMGWHQFVYTDTDGTKVADSAAQGRRFVVAGDAIALYSYSTGAAYWGHGDVPEDSYGLSVSDFRRVHIPHMYNVTSACPVNPIISGWDSYRYAVDMEEGRHYPITVQDDQAGGQKVFVWQWDYSRPFAGADRIINKTQWKDLTFSKVWDDAGHEDKRPESTTFDLYDGTGKLVKTVSLGADDAVSDTGMAPDGHIWRGSFGEWLSVSDDGGRVPYVIRERPVAGYETLYDSDDPMAMATEVTLSADTPLTRQGICDMGVYFQSDAFDSSQDGSCYYAAYGDRYDRYVRENPDGSLTLVLPGSRFLLREGSLSAYGISVSRGGMRDGAAAFSRQAAQNRASVKACLEQFVNPPDSRYELHVASPTSSETSFTRGENRMDGYLLVEWTEPFAYDNIIRNRVMREVRVKKQDPSGTGLAGAEIGFARAAGIDAGRIARKWVTPADGEGGAGLAPGTYLVRELSAPAGHAMAQDIRIRVSPSGTAYRVAEDGSQTELERSWDDFSYATIEMTDEETAVKIEKLGDDGLPLVGASLQVLDDNGTTVAEFTSDKDGVRLSGTLTSGKAYVLHETDAPAGYALAEDVRFVVRGDATASKPQVVTMRNRLIRAQISKKAVSGEDEMPGARLTLSEKGTGETIDEWVSGTEPHAIDAGALERGKTYVLHEEGAPDGYAYAEDMEFVAGKAGSQDAITMRDKPTHVEISKVAITGGDEIPGASLRVTDASGATVDEWTSGTEPHAIVGTLVAGGTYVLHEEAAPEGYAVASDIEFSVSMDGSVDHVEMVDEALPVDGGTSPSESGKASDATVRLADRGPSGRGSAGGNALLQTGDALPVTVATILLTSLTGWAAMAARRHREAPQD